MILYIKSTFSSAHFYSRPEWSEQKNREVFGRCFTPFGHGHNYTLEVGFQSSPESFLNDQKTYQMVLNLLTEKLDHEHLNFVIPEFKTQIPTTENIAVYFMEKLQQRLSPEKIASVKLFEMDTLWTEIRP